MLRTRYRYITVSSQITNQPTLIFGIQFATTGAGVGVTLYDAPIANTEHIIMHAHEIANSYFQMTFTPPIQTERGLYIALESSVDNLTVQFVEGSL